MEKWRDLNIKRNKENSRKGRVAGRKEGGSFLLFKVRLRVIHKKKKNREKEELEREAPSSLYIFRQSDHRSSAKQERSLSS